MENLEEFLKFDPRFGDAQGLDRRVFDAALEYYSYFHDKKVSEMSKEEAYKALIEFRDYCNRESRRWVNIEHKLREMLHDKNAWSVEAPSLMTMENPTEKEVPLEQHFDIFKRDNFECRYCGVKGTDEELETVFQVPPEEGGSIDMENLATACVDCKNKIVLARARQQ